MDWNADGRHDLLVGDAEGKVQIYLNTNTNTDPVLSRGRYIRTGESELDVGERAAPDVDDWNNDGKKDLLVGNMEGTIRIYINKGTDSEPLFDSFYLLQSGRRDFDIGSRSAPRTVDWNRDGLKDILVGEAEGYVYYLKNVGNNSAPVFERAEKLFLYNGDVLRYPVQYARSRLFVTDWDNDGHADMVLGGSDGKIVLFRSEQNTWFSPGFFLNRTWHELNEGIRKLVKILQN